MIGTYEITPKAHVSVCLRVKVKIRVAEPLMRGMFLDDDEDEDGDTIVKEANKKKEGEEEGKNWCYFRYEFLQ